MAGIITRISHISSLSPHVDPRDSVTVIVFWGTETVRNMYNIIPSQYSVSQRKGVKYVLEGNMEVGLKEIDPKSLTVKKAREDNREAGR